MTKLFYSIAFFLILLTGCRHNQVSNVKIISLNGNYYKWNFVKGDTTKIEYDYVHAAYEDLLIVGNKTDNKIINYGVINLDNELIIPIEYPLIDEYRDGYFIFGIGALEAIVKIDETTQVFNEEKVERMGVIDKNGQIIIPPKYKKLKNLGKGLFAFRNVSFLGYSPELGLHRARYGIIDLNENVLCENKFTEIFGFTDDNIARAMIQGGSQVENTEDYLYIDKNCIPIGDKTYEEVLPFYEGLGAIKLDGKWGFIIDDRI